MSKILLSFLFFVNWANLYGQWAISDPLASKETVNLHANLLKMRNKYILFGQQDATAYGVSWAFNPDKSDAKSSSGSYPAVYGWDLGNIELGKAKNLDGIPFNLMRKRIIEAFERGGVNTISWHMHNPFNNASAWDTTNFSVRNILPGGKVHRKYKLYLNRAAAFLKSLKTSAGLPVPVVFRPFHEHTGSWFWWGKRWCSPEEYQQLWQFTIDYLRNKKDIHQLLVAYSSSDVVEKSNYLERYPGDDYVDVMGFDTYCMNDETYIKSMGNSLRIISEIANEHHKLMAVTETGAEQIPNPNWYTEVLVPTIKPYALSWVLVWRNANNRPNHYYVPYLGHPAEADFKKFRLLPKILFQQALGPMDVYNNPQP